VQAWTLLEVCFADHVPPVQLRQGKLIVWPYNIRKGARSSLYVYILLIIKVSSTSAPPPHTKPINRSITTANRNYFWLYFMSLYFSVLWVVWQSHQYYYFFLEEEVPRLTPLQSWLLLVVSTLPLFCCLFLYLPSLYFLLLCSFISYFIYHLYTGYLHLYALNKSCL
jgi:uncharacterized membrane protein